MDKQAYFDAACERIKSFGFRVFAHENKPGDFKYYYGYFSDGKNIGYFQLGDFFGVRWSTVNGPGSHGCGSGFSCEDEGVGIDDLTVERLREAFQGVPYWYRLGKGERVCKWQDLDTFLRDQQTRKEKGWFTSNLVEV